MKRIWCSLVVSFTLAGCGDGGSTAPQPIATGAWTGSMSGMSLAFTVNSAGNGITEIRYTFSGLSCGGTTLASGSIILSQTPPWPITNRHFEIIDTSPPAITVAGTFGADGVTVSGTWSWLTCSGNWSGSH